MIYQFQITTFCFIIVQRRLRIFLVQIVRHCDRFRYYCTVRIYINRYLANWIKLKKIFPYTQVIKSVSKTLSSLTTLSYCFKNDSMRTWRNHCGFFCKLILTISYGICFRLSTWCILITKGQNTMLYNRARPFTSAGFSEPKIKSFLREELI